MDVSERRARLEQFITDEPADHADDVRRLPEVRTTPSPAAEAWATAVICPDLRAILDNYGSDLERLEAWAAILAVVDDLAALEMADGNANALPGVWDDSGDYPTAVDSERYEADLRADLAEALDTAAAHELSSSVAAEAA